MRHFISLIGGGERQKIIRRDGAAGLGENLLGRLARDPGALALAYLRDRARRNADAPRKIGARDAIADEPVGEFHGNKIR